MGATSPVLNEELFWFGDDDGTDESDNTFLGAKNSNQTLLVDTNYRYRTSVSNTGDKLATSVQLQLEYNHESGGWNPVNASSSVVQMSASTKLTEGNDTTERLAGAQTFDGTNGGQEDNDGLTTSNNLGIAAEIEGDFCFTIISGDVADTEGILLRVTDAGTPLDNYNQTPTITVSESNPITITVGAFALTAAFGTTTVLNPKVISVNAFALVVAMGNVTVSVSAAIVIPVTAFALTGAFGTVTVLNPKVIGISVFAITGAFGSVTILNPKIIGVNVFALTGAFGSTTILRPRIVSVTVFAATLAMGSVSVAISKIISINPFALTAAFGSTTILNPKVVTINPFALTLAMGSVTISLGAPITISVNVFALTGAFNSVAVLNPKIVGINVFALTAAFGAVTTLNPKIVTVNTFALSLAMGNVTIAISGPITIPVSTFVLLLAMGAVNIAVPAPPAPSVASTSPGHDWRAVDPRIRRMLLRGILPEEFEEIDAKELEEIILLTDDLDNL